MINYKNKKFRLRDVILFVFFIIFIFSVIWFSLGLHTTFFPNKRENINILHGYFSTLTAIFTEKLCDVDYDINKLKNFNILKKDFGDYCLLYYHLVYYSNEKHKIMMREISNNNFKGDLNIMEASEQYIKYSVIPKKQNFINKLNNKTLLFYTDFPCVFADNSYIYLTANLEEWSTNEKDKNGKFKNYKEYRYYVERKQTKIGEKEND